jgi:hypothetical protein
VTNSRRLMCVLPSAEDRTLPHLIGKAALCITAKLAADVSDGSQAVKLRTSKCFPICPQLQTCATQPPRVDHHRQLGLAPSGRSGASPASQAADRTVRHTETPSNVHEYLASFPSRNGFLTLIRTELRRAPHRHTAGLGACPPLDSSGADQVPFEFGQPAEDREQQPTMWHRYIGPSIGQQNICWAVK